MIKNLTKDEVYFIIDKVAKNHRNKSFGSYTTSDIEQQVWIIALERIQDFNPTRGTQVNLSKSLEHWLNTVVSNRLSNFFRDKHVVPSKQSNINNPISLESQGEIKESDISFENITTSEYWHLIIKDLNEYQLEILECMLSGELINSYYKSKLIHKIKSIVSAISNEKS